jgi:hypothetical protein
MLNNDIVTESLKRTKRLKRGWLIGSSESSVGEGQFSADSRYGDSKESALGL